MDDLDILEEMIEKPHIEIHNGVIKLEENEDGNKYRVIISNAPDNCVVIKADDCSLLRNKGGAKEIFRNIKDKGIRKQADYIIVCKSKGKKGKKGKKRLFYIELKNGRKRTKVDIPSKLKSAKCLMEYFRAIGVEFWKQKQFLNFDKYEIRYIGFLRVTSKRTPARQNGKKICNKERNSPDNYFRFWKCKEIDFDDLIKLPN